MCQQKLDYQTGNAPSCDPMKNPVSLDKTVLVNYSDHNDYIKRFIMQSASVGIRDAKMHLSKYLKMVQQGTEVIITDRGRPVGKIMSWIQKANITPMIPNRMAIITIKG